MVEVTAIFIAILIIALSWIIIVLTEKKISKMCIEKLKRLDKIIGWATLATAFVTIFEIIFVIMLLNEINELILIMMFSSIYIFGVLFAVKFAMINLKLKKKEIEQENQKKISLLKETERQVKIINGYSLVLNGLLREEDIVTAKYIEKTDKVALRFEMVDDEGKTFFKTLELDEDRIIYDLEIL